MFGDFDFLDFLTFRFRATGVLGRKKKSVGTFLTKGGLALLIYVLMFSM